MKVYTTLIATLLVIALMTPTVSTQTDRKIDYTQMVEDIEIMCRIIDRNMKELFPKEYHHTGPFKKQGCQGFYLKNYGVIFTLEVQFPVTQKEIPLALKKKQKADLWQELEREIRHLPPSRGDISRPATGQGIQCRTGKHTQGATRLYHR